MMDAAMLLALLGAGLLSYHGGLHAWQAPVAAAALLGALWAGRDRLPSWSGLDAWERALALLWAALLPGALLGLRPQFSLNAWAVVGALLALLALLRRSPRPLLGAVQGWVLVSGVLYSALFLAYGFFAVGGYAGEELYGPVVRPHISARLFQPNQNLLAGGYSLPALLLATALWLGAVRKSRSVALAAVALLTGATVVYAGSRGVYLALAGGLAWMGLRWAAPRAKAVIVFGLLLAVIALGAWKAPFSILAYRMTAQAEGKPAADTNNLRRKDFWAGAARLSLERPLLGHGLAGFSAAALRLDLPTALTERQPIARYRLRLEHAHNEWLELAVEAGWPVALGAAILVLAWLRRRWRSGSREPAVLGLEAGVVAAFILSLTDMNLRTPALAWSMLLVLAALEPLGSRSDSKRGRSQLALLAGLFALVLCVGWHQRQSLSLQRKAGEAVSPRRVKAAL
jgi:O-antigen ligase